MLHGSQQNLLFNLLLEGNEFCFLQQNQNPKYVKNVDQNLKEIMCRFREKQNFLF